MVSQRETVSFLNLGSVLYDFVHPAPNKCLTQRRSLQMFSEYMKEERERKRNR